jgi:hypothetical protein
VYLVAFLSPIEAMLAFILKTLLRVLHLQLNCAASWTGQAYCYVPHYCSSTHIQLFLLIVLIVRNDHLVHSSLSMTLSQDFP